MKRHRWKVEMPATPAHYVIGKFGGLTKTANALGLAVSTVQGWQGRGRIPQDHWEVIIKAARDIGEKLEFSDFIQSQPAPKRARAS
jgi:hypothetical protein